MKKYFIFLISFIALITACDIDDICTEPTTPNLILRFYDATNTETTKNTDSLYVWAEGKDTLFMNLDTDSIAIPLNILEPETIYNFSSGTQLLNKLTVNYTSEEDHVSRSCGFRFIFKDLQVSIDNPANGWISSITPSTLPSITDQNLAHVQVFH